MEGYVYPTFERENTTTLYNGSNKPRKAKVSVTKTASSSPSAKMTVFYEDDTQTTITGDELAFIAMLQIGATMKKDKQLLVIWKSLAVKTGFKYLAFRTNKSDIEKEILSSFQVSSFDLKDDNKRSYRLQLTRTHISVIEHRLLSAEKYDDSHRAAVEGCVRCLNSSSYTISYLSDKRVEVKGADVDLILAMRNDTSTDLLRTQVNSRKGRTDSKLPPIPTPPEYNDSSSNVSVVSRSCGLPPATLDEPPFFYDELTKPVPVNTNPPGRVNPIMVGPAVEIDTKLKAVGIGDADRDIVYSHRQAIRRMEPSVRFNKFIKSVYQDKQYETLFKRVTTSNDGLNDTYGVEPSIYDIPLVDCPADNNESVEHTIHNILQRLRDKRHVFLNKEFGLSMEEWEKFTLRLEFTETDMKSGGWKDFAVEVVLLEPDDLRLIDEVCARHGLSILVVMLEHWHYLHVLGSRKCLKEASKESIIFVLRKLSKRNLLDLLGWT